MKVLIGTKNMGKIQKYSEMLKELSVEYYTLKDMDIDVDVSETGTTIEENSKIKARAYYEIVKIPVIVDDSGLELDELPPDMQPGVYVRRHNGRELTDEEIIDFYSKEIEQVGGKTVGAFNIAITIIDEEGNEYTKVTRHERIFVSKPCEERVKGYPMNSLIYDEKTGKYLAQGYNKDTILTKNKYGQEEFEFIKNHLAPNMNRGKER